MDPSIWEQPELFKPERFATEKVSQVAFSPFGIGNRSCIGKRFAEYEFITVLILLLQRFNLELVDNQQNLETEVILTLQPKKQIQVKFVPRK